jgi:hypothetical protein
MAPCPLDAYALQHRSDNSTAAGDGQFLPSLRQMQCELPREIDAFVGLGSPRRLKPTKDALTPAKVRIACHPTELVEVSLEELEPGLEL